MRLNDPSRKLTTDQLQQELQEMERAVTYYKKLSDEVAGYNILVDSRMILLKRELQQKNDGFSILSSLHKVIGTKVDLDELLQQTLHLILTTLKMDKAVILWRENDEPLLAKWHLGYNTEQIAQLKSQSFDDATLLHEEHILVNKASRPEEKIGKLLHSLELPFAVGIPLYDGKKVRGWMIGGRHKEAQPFYPPLSNGDLFTFHAVGVFLEAAIDNIMLYRDLEQINTKLESYNIELEREVQERTRDIAISNEQLKEEKHKSDQLLLNILPEEIANELKRDGKSQAKLYDNLSVLFTDFVNFTSYAESLSPGELVAELDHCFRAFDDIVHKYDIEKIKTIGDAYLCTGGIAEHRSQIKEVIMAALEMRNFMTNYNDECRKLGKQGMDIRLGIHLGPAIAGVVGSKKFAFDIWGDTVNIASRMESHGIPGKINVSGDVFNACKDDFAFEYRGKMQVKNKGEIDMYFVEPK